MEFCPFMSSAQEKVECDTKCKCCYQGNCVFVMQLLELKKNSENISDIKRKTDKFDFGITASKEALRVYT